MHISFLLLQQWLIIPEFLKVALFQPGFTFGIILLIHLLILLQDNQSAEAEFITGSEEFTVAY